jgi:hypothetical protein
LIPSKVDMSIAEYGNTPIKPAGKPRKKSSSGGQARGNALILQTARDMWSRGRFRYFFRGLPAGLIELAQSHCRVLWTRLEGLDRVNAWVVGFLGLAFGGRPDPANRPRHVVARPVPVLFPRLARRLDRRVPVLDAATDRAKRQTARHARFLARPLRVREFDPFKSRPKS